MQQGLHGAPAAITHDTIELNEAEKELLGTLLAAAQRAGTGTVLRCAGGWVSGEALCTMQCHAPPC
jgi:hypothetical protein